VVEGLAFNTNCRSIDLSNNGVGEKGMKYLAEILENNDVLQVLNLSTNNAGDEGAIALAKILARTPVCLAVINSRKAFREHVDRGFEPQREQRGQRDGSSDRGDAQD